MNELARKLTLRQRIVALVAVAVIPTAAALGYFIATSHSAREHEVRAMALRTSEVAALEMGQILAGANAVLATAAAAPVVRDMRVDCAEYLGNVVDRVEQLNGLAVADPDGRVRCAVGADFMAPRLGTAPWFQEAAHRRDGALVIGTFARRSAEAPPYLPIASLDPLTGRIIVSGIDLGWLSARLGDRQRPPGSVLTLADRDGVIVARAPAAAQFIGRPLVPELREAAATATSGVREIDSPDGTRRIVGYQPTSGPIGLYVGAGYSTDEAFRPIFISTWRTLALAGFGTLAAGLVVWWLADRMFRTPVRRILATVERWRQGEENARIGLIPDGSELGQLAAAIDSYMDSVATAEAERVAAEQHRALLLREMNHRIKNLLATVQAIANQTFKGHADPERLRTFGARLKAMAGAHDLLVRASWQSADLGDTLRTALDPFGLEAGRLTIDGPAVRIAPGAALAIAMALHELCTNAAKYGALSVPEGRVRLSWKMMQAQGEHGRRLRIAWTEAGGPPVTPPEREGFGSQLIRASLAGELGGAALFDYAPDGLKVTLDADAERTVAPPQEPDAA